MRKIRRLASAVFLISLFVLGVIECSKALDKRLLALRINRDIRKQEIKDERIPQVTTTDVMGVNSITVPVLMYHYIRVNPWPTDTVGFGLSVTPYDFAAQMDYLLAHGYHTISPDEFGAAMLYHTPLPPKPIIVTFDDGYQDVYTEAYPILKKRGLKAISFVITGVVGMRDIYLTWPEIEEMAKSGVLTFGAHTVHHDALTHDASEIVKKEAVESKRALEEHLGYPVNWFAYPYGDVNDRVAQLIRESGFVGAFGTKFGTMQSPDILFRLVRIKIGGGEGVYSFAAKLPWNTAIVPASLRLRTK